jgi:Spy/CpxP family protein refolding chaperone
MSRTMSMLVAVGLVLAATSNAAAAQRHCEMPRDLLADALQNECGPQTSGGAPAAQDDKAKRSHKWWLAEESRAEFKITDQQSRDLEAVFQQLLPVLKTNKSDLDREEKAMAQLLAAATSNEATVMQAIERVESARSALSKTRTLMLYRMYRLLSAEQRAKVQAYHERKAQEGNSGLSTRR